MTWFPSKLFQDKIVKVAFAQNQNICAVVRNTPTHCAGVHTVCGEGAEGFFIESVR